MFSVLISEEWQSKICLWSNNIFKMKIIFQISNIQTNRYKYAYLHAKKYWTYDQINRYSVQLILSFWFSVPEYHQIITLFLSLISIIFSCKINVDITVLYGMVHVGEEEAIIIAVKYIHILDNFVLWFYFIIIFFKMHR